MHRLPPQGTLLYKYLSPENASRVLSNGKLRFSPIIEFNDPFELSTFPSANFEEVDFAYELHVAILEVINNKEVITGENSVCDLVRLFQSGAIQDCDPVDFAVEIALTMGRKKIIRTPSPHRKLVHRRLSKIMGALCLSEKNDQILMWSHYAANHQGIVLGLDPAKGGQAFRFLCPVEYLSAYPVNDEPKLAADKFLGRRQVAESSGLDTVKTMLFTKSEHWSYEHEWRSIRSHDGDVNGDHKNYDINSQLVELPAEAFCSLYIGCRTEPAVAADLVKKARLLNSAIQMFDTRISTKCFGLDFKPYGEPWPEEYPDDRLIL